MEMREFRFSNEQESDVNSCVKGLAKLGAAAAYRDYGSFGAIEKVELENYDEFRDTVKETILNFASNIAGIETPRTARDMAYALDNTIFTNIVNTISQRAIDAMMVTYRSPQLERICEIEDIEPGESRSYEIDTKSLPIAQKATYASNMTLVPSYAKKSITLTPKPYTIGISLDFIRIIGNKYDWGRAIARVYAGMIFAQYRLAVSKIFNPTILNGTPLYQANFSGDTFTQLASDVGMLNGGGIESVMALGTIVALNAISALATQGGFTVKDEYIRTAFLNKVYGVDTMVLSQFTNAAAPFTTANAPSLRVIPDNYILLVPVLGDKICKLVRENYIRVKEVAAIDNTLNRMEYIYSQAFDADIATASYFGIQGTAAA